MLRSHSQHEMSIKSLLSLRPRCMCMCNNVVKTFHTSTTCRSKVPSNLKGKNVTSQEWLRRQMNDPYVKKSRIENYRCRSAFKLVEMDDKHGFIKSGSVVIDCGAAPGSWSQVAVQRIQSASGDLQI